MLRIYFSNDTEKMEPYVRSLEKASTGEALKEALLNAIKYANVIHSKKMGTEANNG